MEWTKEPPTQEGWYYRRNVVTRSTWVAVVRVESFGDHFAYRYCEEFESSRSYKIEKDNLHEWAGPIPEPAGGAKP